MSQPDDRRRAVQEPRIPRGLSRSSALGAVAACLAIGCGSSSSSSPAMGSGSASSGTGGSSGSQTSGVSAGAGTGSSTGGAASGSNSSGSATGADASTPDGAAANGDGAPNPEASAGGPPDFGPNVLIFGPADDMKNAQTQLTNLFNQNQFGIDHHAFFFKPGKYSLDVHVSFYTQALGLGQSPDDVVISGAVRSVGDIGGATPGDGLGEFWRGVENLSIIPTGVTTPPVPPANTNMWAVSQGTSFRRVHVLGSLILADSGATSGGFMADSKIDGTVTSASQQQWFSRNTKWGTWKGGVWNMVFAGTDMPPAATTWPSPPYTVVAQTPLIAEKPFLTIDANGAYSVVVPGLKMATLGISWPATTPPQTLPISTFFIAKPTNTAADINAALGAGQNLILTPGVYSLNTSLLVKRANTVVLGIGVPTLVPTTAAPTMIVSDVDGVRIGGIIFDAGPISSPTLLQVGPMGSAVDHSSNPTVLHDVYCRVGGGTAGTAASCLTINSNNTITDNLWLWRADHGNVGTVGWTVNAAQNGIIVNGNNVTAYGLAAEHFQGYQTLWNGNGGQVYFYQSEMPYDVPSQAQWMSPSGGNGFASYKVAASVTSHTAFGLGVYCNFKANAVLADNAFETPTAPGVALHHLVDVFLNGAATSGISNLLNGVGGAPSRGHNITAN